MFLSHWRVRSLGGLDGTAMPPEFISFFGFLDLEQRCQSQGGENGLLCRSVRLTAGSRVFPFISAAGPDGKVVVTFVPSPSEAFAFLLVPNFFNQ